MAGTTLVLAVAGLICDLSGKELGAATVLRVGGHLGLTAVLAGLVALAWRAIRSRRIALGWTGGLALLALARWLRGSAGVAPDPPLLVVQLIGCLLLLLSVWRTISARRRFPSSAPPLSSA